MLAGWAAPIASADGGDDSDAGSNPVSRTAGAVKDAVDTVRKTVTDVGSSLQGVHDHPVLLDVLHRQREEMNSLAQRRFEPGAASADLRQHLRALRVVAHRVDRGAGEDEVRVGSLRDLVNECRQHPDRVLEAIPA